MYINANVDNEDVIESDCLNSLNELKNTDESIDKKDIKYF